MRVSLSAHMQTPRSRCPTPRLPRRVLAGALVALVGLTGCPGDDSSDDPGGEPARPADTPEPVDEVAERLERARQHLAVGDWESALIESERLLQVEADHLEGRLVRGDCLQRLGHLSAIEDFEYVLAREPANARALFGRGRAKAGEGDVEGALADMRRAAELAPGRFEVDLHAWRRAIYVAREQGREVAANLDLLRNELVAIRGLPFERAVPRAPQPLEEFRKHADAHLALLLSDAAPRDVERGLRRLGLLPAGADLRRDTAEALLAQGVAYYDATADQLFLHAADPTPDMLEHALAHELVHALQDQHLELETFQASARTPAGEPRNQDRALGVLAVAEGDASHVFMIWNVRRMVDRPERAPGMAQLGLGELARFPVAKIMHLMRSPSSGLGEEHPAGRAASGMGALPRYVTAPLLRTRFSGALLVANRFERSGWDGVKRLYAEPPESTEQFLHPEKFEGRRDRPTPLTLPALPGIEDEGFRRIDAAVHGELYLRILLLEHGLAAPIARAATAGWDGDTYAAYGRGKNDTAIVLATTWDTEEDAREFDLAYRTILPAKYPGFALEEIIGNGTTYLFDCGDKLGTGGVLLRGREVFVVEGLTKVGRSRVLSSLGELDVEPVE